MTTRKKPVRGAVTIRPCAECATEIKVRVADINRGWGRFCSKSCSLKFRQGKGDAQPVDNMKVKLMIKLSESVITRSPSGTATNSLMPSDFLLESKEKPLDYWLRWLNDNGIQFVWQPIECDVAAEFGDASDVAMLPECRNGQGWVILSLHNTEDGPMCLWGRNQCIVRNNETCTGCPDCGSVMGDATYKEMLPALMEDRIHRLEQERNNLAAHVGAMINAAMNHGASKALRDIIDNGPAVSLAEIAAQVIKDAVASVTVTYNLGEVQALSPEQAFDMALHDYDQALLEYADHLHQGGE